MVTSTVPLTRSACLLASFLTVAVPVFYLDISWRQWRINHGAHGAPAPGSLRLGAFLINEILKQKV